MARKTLNPNLVGGKLALDLTSDLQRVRAKLKRYTDIFDFMRDGGNNDWAALGAALGCSAADATVLFSRFMAIKGAMDGVDFVNLSEIDQG